MTDRESEIRLTGVIIIVAIGLTNGWSPWIYVGLWAFALTAYFAEAAIRGRSSRE